MDDPNTRIQMFQSAIRVGGNASLGTQGQVALYAAETATQASVTDGTAHLEVGGTLSLAPGSTLHLFSAPGTGAGAVMRAGHLNLSPGATVSADGRGYAWYKMGGSLFQNAPGTGIQQSGGGHGGRGGADGSNAGGASYGNPYAPALSGSPSGNSVLVNAAGGGVVRLHVAGTAVLGGILSADGQGTTRGGAGGSIWLTAKTLQVGASGVLRARGGNGTTGSSSGGGGGRIAVGVGFTDEQLALLTSGGLPRATEITTLAARYPGVATVTGGTGVGSGVPGESGTAFYCQAPPRIFVLFVK